MYSVYVGNFLRDVVPMVLEIVLGILVVYLLSRLVISRAGITDRQDETLSQVERKNLIITFVLSFLAFMTHILAFLVIKIYMNIF